MPRIFRNPDLQDYFVAVEGAPNVRETYEDGKVLTFPDLKFDIDHDFWAALPVGEYPGLRKLKSSPDLTDFSNDPKLCAGIKAAGLPRELEAQLASAIRSTYDAVLPIYLQIFEGYRFIKPVIVWRLNTSLNENLHIDLGEDDPHFARLFINLDNQPRIWTTGYTLEQMYSKMSGRIRAKSHKEVREELNNFFYGAAEEWWKLQPRHIIYFDPGEAWSVESRLVAHQIFYGRRAVSIDFYVDPASMRSPDRHFVKLLERLQTQRWKFRLRNLASGLGLRPPQVQ